MAKKPTPEEEPIQDAEPDGFIPIAEEESINPVEEEVVSEETPKETPGETPVETPEETPEKPEETPGETLEETPEEKPAFQFVDKKPADDTKPFMVIKHLGKEVSIATEEDARNFMQKGFDYDSKVGPHGKLAQTIDQHPEFAKRVAKEWESYVSEKVEKPAEAEVKKPELKGLDQYEDANEWFWDNYKKVREHEAATAPPVQRPAPTTEIPSWVSSLVTHDPDNFNVIAPLIPQYAERFLTVEQYNKVNNDLPALVQFYDQVKKHVLTEKPKTEVISPEKPSFRMKSGGGAAPTPIKKPPWEDMNNDDFEKEMARVKGIASY